MGTTSVVPITLAAGSLLFLRYLPLSSLSQSCHPSPALTTLIDTFTYTSKESLSGGAV